MFSREQIIEEIKRVAQELGTSSLSQREFELNSTVPISSLRFYLGSWARASQEAGLQYAEADGNPSIPVAKEEPANEDDLLMDLLRLHEDTGEFPTPSLIAEKGKYDESHYKERWKSVSEAYLAAKKKFASDSSHEQPSITFFDVHQSQTLEKEDYLQKVLNETDDIDSGSVEPLDEELPTPFQLFPDRSDFFDALLEASNEPQIESQDEEPIKPVISPTNQEINVINEPLTSNNVQFIPQNKKGVIYLFGIISNKLGYILESISSDFPEAEAKRCSGTQELFVRWEQLKLHFEYRSLDIKKYEDRLFLCDLVVCWHHDWEECPIPVLSLKAEPKRTFKVP